jgi:transposase InsO family protein
MKFNQVATGLGRKTSQKEFAQAVDVVPRTIRNWKKRTRPEDFPKLGRPAHDERAHRNAFWKVGREYLRQGRCGAAAIAKALQGSVPLRLVREYVKRFKECERMRERVRILERRERIEVLTKNAIWVQDSAQVARTPEGEKIESQIIKDRGPCITVGISTGGPTRGTDAIDLLEALRTTRGLPLVLGSDNGSPFVCKEVEEYLRKHQVIHLRSLPRTPQHNGAAEVGIGEIKRCARIGAAVMGCVYAAHAEATRAATVLNKNRLRASKGFKTGEQLDETMVVSYHQVERALFYGECSKRIDEIQRSGLKYRAMRMAERDAIYGKLESYGLIKRYRGGSQATAKTEIFL